MTPAPQWQSTSDHVSAPGAWQSTSDHAAQAPKPEDKGFFSTLGSDIASIPGHVANFVQHPIDSLTSTGTALTQGREQAWQQAKDAYSKGNYKEAAEHALFSFPVLGPGLNAAANELRAPEDGQQPDATHQDVPGQGSAHAVENLAPFVLPELARAVPPLAEAAGNAGAAVRAGVKAAAPDVLAGAGKVAAGEAVGAIPGMEWPARMALGYPGIRQIVKGAGKGVDAGKAALADRLAAATESLRPQPTPAASTPPAGLLGPGAIAPPAPPDGSFVRSAPAQYPAFQPKGLLGEAPRVLTPDAPPDGSFVRSVPAEYPEGGAQPAPAEDPLLNEIAIGTWKQPFAQLPADTQNTIRGIAERMSAPPAPTPAPAQAAAPAPAPPPMPSPAAAPLTAAQQAQQLFDAARQSGTIPEEAQPGQPLGGASAPAPEPPQVGANADVKGLRFAQALHQYGITQADARSIPMGSVPPEDIAAGELPGWQDITNDLVKKGFLKPGELPPDRSLPRIIFHLGQFEKDGTLPVPSTAPAAAPDVSLTPGVPNAAPSSPRPSPALDPGAASGQPASALPNPSGGPAGAVPSGSAGASATVVRVPGTPTRYPANYEVKELADVQASHSGRSFQPNPKYTLFNDRDYTQTENQGKVVNWSTPNGFDPEYHLTESPTASDGAPVIDSQGNVLGGNGRTMILDRVYGSNPQGAADYRARLTQKAPQFGIDPAQVQGMKEPVLVRTIADHDLVNPQQAVTDFNKTGTAALRPSEAALADSRRVSQPTLDNIAARLEAKGTDATLADVLGGTGGPAVLNNLIGDGVIGEQESAAYIKGNQLTPAGKTRVSQLMLGRFFRDPAQLDATPPSIVNKLERVAAPLAQVEGSGEWSLARPMHDAMDLLEQARAAGSKNLDDVVAQSGLFADQTYSPESLTLAKSIQNLNPNDLTDAVRHYAQEAAGARGGNPMFGQASTPQQSLAEAFDPDAISARRAAKKQAASDMKLKLSDLAGPNAPQQ